MKPYSQFVSEAQSSREQQFFNDIKTRAKRQGATDVESNLIAAQGALETGWGKSPSGSWNYFGQKASSNEKGTSKGTFEYGASGRYNTSAKFKDYDSLDSSIADRINKWSYKTRGSKDVEDAATRLQIPGGQRIPGSKEVSHGAYATSPIYVSSVSRIARDYGGSKVSSPSQVNSSKPYAAKKGSLDTPSPTRVLAKLKGKSGELNKTTGKFTQRKWSNPEGTRYKAYGGK
jgi:flagellum-specific peptidoglycan hydrolase FlgJ